MTTTYCRGMLGKDQKDLTDFKRVHYFKWADFKKLDEKTIFHFLDVKDQVRVMGSYLSEDCKEFGAYTELEVKINYFKL